MEMYEFIQYPGDIIFVPGGWWHAVVNLDDTVAVTENYCSSANFDKVWRSTRRGRKKMSCLWYRCLQERYPRLSRRADKLNRRDGFKMNRKHLKHYPEEMQRKRRKRRRHSSREEDRKRARF